MKCLGCDRSMRPKHRLVTDFPGTVEHKGGGRCKPCWLRARAAVEQGDVRVWRQSLDVWLAERRERLAGQV